MMAPTNPAPGAKASGFDPRSGSLIERALFNHRAIVVLLCALVTVLLGWQATRLQLNASFEKTIPAEHRYIRNFLVHQGELTGLGNAVRIAVANPQGSVYDAKYLETLRQLSDEVFLLPGVARNQMKSLWTPTTRWVGVTEEGLEGGPVIPDGYDGSPKSLEQLRANIARSGEIGQLVALDAKSSVIYVPLLAHDAEGRALDYAAFAQRIETLRTKYAAQGVDIHITGFAKIVGDLIDGVRAVLGFFLLAVAIATAAVFWYTRCVRSTLLVVAASLVAVVWQLGLLPALGYTLDPYSILVPFLVFAIGMSHGAQKMNGIMQDIGRGLPKLVAARFTFRRLFLAGLTALLADAVGFAVLLVIDIQAIRELAIAASIGVAVLIFTNLILLPILLSTTGVSATAAQRSLRAEAADAAGAGKHPLWAFLDRYTQRRHALIAIMAAVLLGALGFAASTQLKIGDLDPGAPELRADSRYNRDVAFVNAAYGASSDVLAVMVKAPDGQCSRYETLNKVDALEWQLRQLDGVESTNSLALLNRRVLAGLNEGSPKWYEFLPNQDMLNTVTAGAPRGLYNDACSLLTLSVYLRDHKAETLARVVDHVEAFAAANDTADVKFLLAAGSAGIEAATNIVVKDAWRTMLALVYAAVALLALVTFRSWRAVVVAILPLMLTSVLAEALMVALGMGVKVATLPVIALGVGIGVDYALYILSVTLGQLREGRSLSESYYRALLFTGKVVMLTGVTLAIGVITWVASPIKFQADMGLLLAFMFLWNMLGALVLLPALAHFLLKRSPAVAENSAAFYGALKARSRPQPPHDARQPIPHDLLQPATNSPPGGVNRRATTTMKTTPSAPRRRVAVIGAGPGGLAAALAFHRAGHEVRLFERQEAVKPLGGAVLLSLPVLSVLRDMGVDIHALGAYGVTEFRNHRGRLRARLPFNPRAEARAGIPGWHYGMLRSAAVERMLAVMPPGLIHAGKAFTRYVETVDSVTAHFADGSHWEADLLVGADGIRSTVAQQTFGELGLFHCGIQVWLAWCHCDGVPRDVGWISHSRKVQASFFPILHDGRPAVEWWVVEPWNEGQRFEGDVRAHLMRHLSGWADPLPRLAAATDFERHCFRWEIYNRPALPSWSKGRVSFVGDAVHPVSPYAAYGMGMAIEDGWWLAKCLEGVDLARPDALARGLAQYDHQRVAYTNKNARMARTMGYLFHRTPWPLSALRDAVFDHTPFLEAMLVRNYLKDAEVQMESLPIAAR